MLRKVRNAYPLYCFSSMLVMIGRSDGVSPATKASASGPQNPGGTKTMYTVVCPLMASCRAYATASSVCRVDDNITSPLRKPVSVGPTIAAIIAMIAITARSSMIVNAAAQCLAALARMLRVAAGSLEHMTISLLSPAQDVVGVDPGFHGDPIPDDILRRQSCIRFAVRSH